MIDSINRMQARLRQFEKSEGSDVKQHLVSHLDSQIDLNRGYQGLDSEALQKMRRGLFDQETKRLESELGISKRQEKNRGNESRQEYFTASKLGKQC